MIKLNVILTVLVFYCTIFFVACVSNTPNKLNISFHNSPSGFDVIITEKDTCQFIFCYAKDDDFYNDVDDELSQLNTENPINLAVCNYSDFSSDCISSLIRNYPIDTIFLPTPITTSEHDKFVTLKRLFNSSNISYKVVNVSEVIDDRFCVRLFNPMRQKNTNSSALSFVITFDNCSFGFLLGNENNQKISASLINMALSDNISTMQYAVNLDFLAFIPKNKPNESVLDLLTANNLYLSKYTEFVLESIYDNLPLTTVYTDKIYKNLSLSVTENNLLSITTD